ncbi:MAG: NADH-quinone oxidoreductase subunit NuoE [Cyanobacteriota bacterium]
MKTIQVSPDVREVVQKHGKKREYLLAILQELCQKKKYLTEEVMRDVAFEMNLSANEIYSVATFYSFIKTKPAGKFVVRVCNTISCELAGKEELIKALERELRVKVGGTTDDQKFTLETTACMGMCDQGPAMLVNDDVYTKLDTKKVVEIIREYKARKD